MLITNAYTYNPIEFNNLNQAQIGYAGIDSIQESILPKGTIITALEGPQGGFGGNYFITPNELRENNLDSIKLCQGVQVAPYQQDKSSPCQYKTNARLYVLNEDTMVAKGNTTENTHYGIGELEQIVVPNGKNMIKDAYEDNSYNSNHTIIPLDLNNFQDDPRLSLETKEQLNDIRSEFSNNICDDGSILLNNKDLSKEAYKAIHDSDQEDFQSQNVGQGTSNINDNGNIKELGEQSSHKAKEIDSLIKDEKKSTHEISNINETANENTFGNFNEETNKLGKQDRFINNKEDLEAYTDGKVETIDKNQHMDESIKQSNNKDIEKDTEVEEKTDVVQAENSNCNQSENYDDYYDY